MERRRFLQGSLAGLALSAARGYSEEFADTPPKRVGLIGCGWYGKSDIFRLVQIAPVEIVSLCDVDKKNLEEAAQWAVERQASKNKPRLYTDYREMLREGGLDMVEINPLEDVQNSTAEIAMELISSAMGKSIY